METNRSLINYQDIKMSFNSINAWEVYEAFPINGLTEIERLEIQEIEATLCVFKGVMTNPNLGADFDKDKLFEILFNDFYAFIERTIKRVETNVFLLSIEQRPKAKNKRRTYLGFLKEEGLENRSYIEKEFSIKETDSYFISLVAIENSSLKIIPKYFQKSNSALIISRDDSFFSENFLDIVAEQYVNVGTITTINYLKLILKYCPVGDIICRTAGDGGDEEISLQIFHNKLMKDFVFKIAGDN